MKNILSLSFLILLACSESKPQEKQVSEIEKGLYLYSKKVDGGIYADYKLYGYVNSNKEIVIEAKYDFADPFKGSVAKVSMVKEFYDTRSRGRSERMVWGLINESDSLLISMDYYELKDYQNDKFVALGPTQSFIFNSRGDTLKKLYHHEESDKYMGDSIKIVAKNRELGLVDKDYNYIVKPRFSWIGNVSEDRILVTWRNSKNEERIGYIDTNGKEIIPAKFRRAGPFNNGIALVGTYDNHRLIINKSGVVIDTLNQKYIDKRLSLSYTNPDFNPFKSCIENLERPGFFYAVYDCSDTLFQEKLLDNYFGSCLGGGECSNNTTHKIYKDGHLKIYSGYDRSPTITYSLNSSSLDSAINWSKNFLDVVDFNIESEEFIPPNRYQIKFKLENNFEEGALTVGCFPNMCEISPYIYQNY